MLGSFLWMAVCLLPVSLPAGLVCYAAAQLGLRRKNKIVRTAVGAVLLLCLALLFVRMVYGVLRFNGVILFADDNCMSYYWYGASWRDDGFELIYWSGVAFTGVAAALLEGRRGTKKSAPAGTDFKTLQ